MATSSRLIVKNLPKFLDENSLKTHFQQYGRVSDAKIIFKGEKNRCFGFVGYIRDEDAETAQKELNNSFMHTNKLSVEFAITNDQMEGDDKFKGVVKRKKEKGTADKSAYESKKIKNELESIQQNDSEKQILKKRKFDDFLKEMEIPDSQVQSTKKKLKAADAEAESKPVANPQDKLDTSELDEKRLYVTNIPYNIDKEDVRVLFEKYGPVTECITPRDPSGNSRGIAYISYEESNDAIQSMAKLDNKIAFGRILHIKQAFGSRRQLYKETNKEFAKQEYEKSSFKQIKKGQFMRNLDDTTSWNTLFLNPNTVMDLVSKSQGVSKSDMFDKECENPAVKIATAETEVINEAKEFQKNHGINIDIFTSDRKECPRSNKIILAKNLSLAMTKKKLMNLFGNYGTVSKCIMPKNRALGIVKFDSEEHASNAFKLLSGFNTEGCVLYLEWGPLDIFTEDDELAQETNKNPLEAGLGEEFDQKPAKPEPEVEKIEAVANNFNTEKDEMLDKAMTVFVKNLNFSTTEEVLSEFMNELGFGPKIKSMKLITKNGLSAGFGFVEFWDGESATKFIKNHQGALVEHHSQKLSISKPPAHLENRRTAVKSHITPSTKIVIRNVDFAANMRELKDLLTNYGELKAIRMPRKPNGEHRGFGFAEYMSIDDAKEAFSALAHTHFYGRKLVIEYAQD